MNILDLRFFEARVGITATMAFLSLSGVLRSFRTQLLSFAVLRLFGAIVLVKYGTIQLPLRFFFADLGENV